MRKFLLLIFLFIAFSYHHTIYSQSRPKAIEIKEATSKDKKTEPIATPIKKKPVSKPPKPTPPPPPAKPTPEKKRTETPVHIPVTETEPQPTEVTPIVQAPSTERFDSIVKMGGKKLPVKNIRIGANEVNFFTLDGNAQQLRRKDIEKILYKNGKIEVFNKPVFQVVKETSWEAIYVTDNSAEVEGFFEIEKIRASASSNQRSMKDAKQSATIRLQKKAAQMGAVMVLVTNREAKGGYGEVPGYDIEGIAYSSEPKPKAQKK